MMVPPALSIAAERTALEFAESTGSNRSRATQTLLCPGLGPGGGPCPPTMLHLPHPASDGDEDRSLERIRYSCSDDWVRLGISFERCRRRGRRTFRER